MDRRRKLGIYIKGNDLERDVYVIQDHRFGLPIHILLQLLKPVYGITESGDYWFDKYTSFLNIYDSNTYQAIRLSITTWQKRNDMGC